MNLETFLLFVAVTIAIFILERQLPGNLPPFAPNRARVIGIAVAE